MNYGYYKTFEVSVHLIAIVHRPQMNTQLCQFSRIQTLGLLDTFASRVQS